MYATTLSEKKFAHTFHQMFNPHKRTWSQYSCLVKLDFKVMVSGVILFEDSISFTLAICARGAARGLPPPNAGFCQRNVENSLEDGQVRQDLIRR